VAFFEVIAAHQMLGLQVPDDRLESGATPHLADRGALTFPCANVVLVIESRMVGRSRRMRSAMATATLLSLPLWLIELSVTPQSPAGFILAWLLSDRVSRRHSATRVGPPAF
jgi:hypothetical protein